MDNLHGIFLALLQGVTEFLPVSSSAHLVLAHEALGLRGDSLAFDVTVHAGTLSAVIWHYRSQLAALLLACKPRASGYASGYALGGGEDRRLLAALAVASLPVLAVGFAFETAIEEYLRAPPVIAAATVVFALALWFADARRSGHVREITWRCALWIGVAQTLALIPGTSRTGVTITAALLLGLSRERATHFSLLLAIPVILAATASQASQLVQAPTAWAPLALGFAVAAAFALATIRLFVRFVEKVGMLPFVAYRCVLGALLFVFIYL